MKYQWQALLEVIWPARSGRAGSQARRMTLMQAAIALAIFVAWGPEIFAAMEMTALLEMLGASLFLTAYAAGARLAAKTLWRTAYDILLPAAQMSVLRSGASTGEKACASIYVANNAAWWAAGALVTGMFAMEYFPLQILKP
jgi:hypothetical protein